MHQSPKAFRAAIASGPCRIGGFSLIELMIAMTLGLLVIAGLGQLYVGGRDANRIIDNTARLNDNGRFAAEFLARDLRLAGYFSCGGAKANVANAVDEQSFWFKLQGIEGYEGGADTLPSAFTSFPAVLSGTDVFMIRYADVRGLVQVPSGGFDDNNHRFTFDGPHPFQVSNIAVLNDANCSQTSIFQVTDAENSDADYSISFAADAGITPGNCTTRLAGSYDCSRDSASGGDEFATNPTDEFEGASIGRFVARAFFVANDDVDNCPPAGVCGVLAACPTLFVAGTDQAEAVAVLHDVTDMQVKYGVDDQIGVENGRVITPGDKMVDRYLDADEIGGDLWLKVASMRINLELVTRDCRNKAFSTTVALRNAGIVMGDW